MRQFTLCMAFAAIAFIFAAPAANAQASDPQQDAVTATNRMFRSNLEVRMYTTIWEGMEKLLRDARPDIPGQDLAKAQFVVRQRVRALYDEISPPLVDALRKTFSDEELHELATVNLTAETMDRFRASKVGEKFFGPGMKAANAAINGPLLKSMQDRGQDVLSETYLVLVDMKIAAPPQDAAGSNLPPEYQPVAPMPPIPLDRKTTQ